MASKVMGVHGYSKMGEQHVGDWKTRVTVYLAHLFEWID